MKYKYRFYVTENCIEKVKELILKFRTERLKVVNQFRYYYIVDHILTLDRENIDVKINRNLLSKILGTKNSLTSELIDDLLKSGVIDSDGFYKKGVESRKYTIPLEDKDYLQVIHFSDKEFKPLEKMIKYNNQRNLLDFTSTIEGKLYYNYVSNITIEHNSINLISKSLYESHILYLMGGKIEVEKFSKEMINVRRILNGDIYVKRPVPESRVYCNLSNLKREFRKHLRYEGLNLQAIDITASQPTLAGMLILSKINDSELPLKLEIKQYLELCQSGMFYERFMNDCLLDGETRSDFKKRFFGEVFFCKPSKRLKQITKIFQKEFPMIYDKLVKLKGGYRVKGDRTYAKFAEDLQKFEASIIYDSVNIRLLKEGKGCFNIYDSIVSHSKETLDIAKSYIEEEFIKYGVVPNIKYEIFE